MAWIVFNQYSWVEGGGRLGELGVGEGGSRIYLRAGSGSRNKKGTHLLFLTVYHPV